MEEFTRFKNSKDIELIIRGDLGAISKLEVELNKKYIKLIKITVDESDAKLKCKDALLDEIMKLANDYGLTIIKEK